MRSAIIVPFLVSFAALAHAATPAEVLEQLDAEMMSAKDQFFIYDMKTTKKDGSPVSSFTIQAAVKGRHWRRVDFLAPADRKGVRLLVLSPTQMYIYLPQFKKVRRVASHVQEQGFMGTAYDHAEVSLSIYGEIFRPVRVLDSGKTWTLFLERREGQDYVHTKLEIDVDKKYSHPVRIRYMNADGKCVKTETRRKFHCSDGLCRPREVTMVDHGRDDLTTVMSLRTQKVNTGAPDSYFTLRALEH